MKGTSVTTMCPVNNEPAIKVLVYTDKIMKTNTVEGKQGRRSERSSKPHNQRTKILTLCPLSVLFLSFPFWVALLWREYGKLKLGLTCVTKTQSNVQPPISVAPNPKTLNVSSYICFCPIQWRHVLSREWRCSWSSADMWCSNYIQVINNFIAF